MPGNGYERWSWDSECQAGYIVAKDNNLKRSIQGIRQGKVALPHPQLARQSQLR
jgi:hypothetical protein